MKTNSKGLTNNRTKLLLFCIFALFIGLSINLAKASESDGFHYHYIPLSGIPLPPGFQNFIPLAINDNGLIYGGVDDGENSYVAVYAKGSITVLQPESGFVTTGAINARGLAGGSVLIDPVNFNFQAALFRGNSVKTIPFLPGDTFTMVLALNDAGTALLWSQSDLNQNIYRLYSKGKVTFNFQLPTGSDFTRAWGVNNRGVVVGRIFDPGLNAFRALRFDPPYRNSKMLNPLPSDTDSSSFGINNAGNTLGSSFIFLGDPNKNHYGIWDKKGNFKTYFEGGNYFALFNDNNLIVLTEGEGDLNSYLVPKPGLRLNLMGLVDNPEEASIGTVTDVNNRGDLVGFSFNGNAPLGYLLRRVFPEE